MIKRILNIIVVLIFIYIVVGLLLYFIQDRFLLHPKKLSRQHRFSFAARHQEMDIPVNNEDTINLMKFLPTANRPKGVVLYFHGNRENIEHYVKYVNRFTIRGYEVWMEDYPGFGKSTGEISEQKLYDQARQIRTLAASRYPDDSVIIYGKSFGTGVAAYTARLQPAKILILETPYYSIPSLFSHYAFMYPAQVMSHYSLPTYLFLQNLKTPVIIFHGTDDEVIPLSQAARLQEMLKPNDQFIEIENGKHNNLTGSPVYEQVMDSVLKN